MSMNTSDPSPAPRMWTPSSQARSITPEDLDAHVARQMEFAEHKKRRIQALEQRYYPADTNPHCVSPEVLERSASRQCDQEMRQREERMKKLQDKYSPAKPKSVTLDHDAIADVAKRMQDGATATQNRKKAAAEQAQKKKEEDARIVEKGRRMTKSDIVSMGDRLCTPKQDMDFEKMIRLQFGPTAQVPEAYIKKAKEIAEREEEMKRARFNKKK